MKYFQHDTNSMRNRKLRKILRTHGPTGYAIWWALLEELYSADNIGFQIVADELWLENLAELLCLSDYRTLIRVFDTFAELNLISRQLWEEHILHVEAIEERGDRYVQQKTLNAKRQAKYREKKKEESRNSNALRNVISNDVTPSEIRDQRSEFIDQKNLNNSLSSLPGEKQKPKQPERERSPEQKNPGLMPPDLPPWKTGPGPNSYNEDFVKFIQRVFKDRFGEQRNRSDAIAYIARFQNLDAVHARWLEFQDSSYNQTSSANLSAEKKQGKIRTFKNDSPIPPSLRR